MNASRFLMGQSNGLKIITLGYSNSGKTYYVGSLNKLQYEVGPNAFKIVGKDIVTVSRIEEIYRILTNEIEGAYIPSTNKMDQIPLTFQQGRDNLFDVEITDIVGQGTQAGRNDDQARALIDKIKSYDAIIIFVKSPNNSDEAYSARAELTRLVNLANILLAKKRGVPVAVVMTQIDKLSSLHKIKNEIEKEVKQYEDEFRNNPDKYFEIENKLKFIRGEIVNPIVAEAMKATDITGLVRHFEQIIKGKNPVPYRIFPATSLGFDNSVFNPFGTESAVTKQLYPYGTIASFFWLIYACSKLNPNRRLDPDFNPDDLLGDVTDLFTSGQAFHDPNSSMFNLRNLSDLHP